MRAGSSAARVGPTLALAMAACGDHAPAEPADDLAPTLAGVERGIFGPSCAQGACHGGEAPAAGLDLTPGRSCEALVGAESCLFAARVLVLPGDPAESFLVAKISGTLPMGQPDGPCRIRTNEPMPYKARALPAERIEQVRQWIAEGAACEGGDGPPDDPAEGTDAPVVAVTAAAPQVRAGGTLQVVVLLERPAPQGGQILEVSVSDAALDAPALVEVTAGATAAELEVRGLRASRPVEITVRGGNAEVRTRVQVVGLVLSEILFDAEGSDDGREWVQLRNLGTLPVDLSGYTFAAGRSSFDYTRVTLSGILAPGGCFLLGGPDLAGQQEASYDQISNFTPDLPNGTNAGGDGAAFAIFEGVVAALSVPLDAVLCGASNAAALPGPDGLPLVPACPDVTPGASVLRRDLAHWEAATPSPRMCEDLL